MAYCWRVHNVGLQPMFQRAVRVGGNGGMNALRTTKLHPMVAKRIPLPQLRGQTMTNFSTQVKSKFDTGCNVSSCRGPMFRTSLLLTPRPGFVMNQWLKQTRSTCLRHRRRNCSNKAEQKPDGGKQTNTGSAESESAPREMSHISWAEFREAPVKSLRRWWHDNSDLFRQYIRNYGGLTLTFYIGMYVGVLAIMWALVELGAVKGPDVNKWLRNSRIKQWISPNKELQVSPHITNFLTAWLLTKTTEPFRILITLFAVPALLRYLPMRMLHLFNIQKRPQFSRATKGAAAAGRVLQRARDTMKKATGRKD
eukprot:gb/GECG01007483.1/.p1 GENE.gb/GECG01007483.1/~~gb/GECG01007483.1/.p1  ORF type:complete len:310 (+),score=15.78 gb/GECG01007483.1/:1-930(+)